MKLSVRLSNDSITILEYRVGNRVQVSGFVQGRMPDGAFKNGIVVDTALVAEALRELLKTSHIKGKQVSLCVSGLDVIQKRLEIPKSAARHVRGLLKNELMKTDALRGGYLFDYIPLEEETGEEGFAAYQTYLLPTELLRNYEQTLKRAGLKLESVEPVGRSMEKLAALFGIEKKKELTILIDAEPSGIDLLMTGAGMKSIYRNVQKKEESIEENIFIVSAIQKVTDSSSPGEQMLEQLTEVVSRLIQFQSQNSRGQGVEQILVYGELASDENFVGGIERRTGIRAAHCRMPEEYLSLKGSGKLQTGLSFSPLGTICGKLVGETKQLRFEVPAEESGAMTFKDHLPFVAGLAALTGFAVYYAVMTMGNNYLEARNERQKEEIARLEQSEEFKRRMEVREELLKLNSYNESCDICIETLEGTRRFTTDAFTEVDKLVPPGITIYGYELEGNVVRFYCFAQSQDGPAEFARIVTDAELFGEVSYTGFEAYREVDGSTSYSFRLECGQSWEEEMQ